MTSRKFARVIYGTRPPTPKQLASQLASRCRRSLNALKTEPSDRDVKDGEIIVGEPYRADANTKIGGHYAWETSFSLPVPVYVFGIYAYEVIRRRGESIAWAGKVVVSEDLDVEFIEIFKKVPSQVAACVMHEM